MAVKGCRSRWKSVALHIVRKSSLSNGAACPALEQAKQFKWKRGD